MTTANQLWKMLRVAPDFNTENVVDVSRDCVEVFNGDGADYDGNKLLAQTVAKITGLNHRFSTAYGGWVLQATAPDLDMENCR